MSITHSAESLTDVWVAAELLWQPLLGPCWQPWTHPNRASVQPLASLANHRALLCLSGFLLFTECEANCTLHWVCFLLKAFIDTLLLCFRYLWGERRTFNWTYSCTEHWACPASSCKPSWKHFWWPDHGLDADSGKHFSKVLSYSISLRVVLNGCAFNVKGFTGIYFMKNTDPGFSDYSSFSHYRRPLNYLCGTSPTACHATESQKLFCYTCRP